MKSKKPLVSIMIPNRNHSIYLGKCIESALDQTYDRTDIVVLDNCSDDNSIETASRYIEKGVRVCRNAMNVGNRSYDILASITDGAYLMLLCADDLIRPTMIEKCVDIMEKHPNVGYVHCERDYIDEHGNITELDPFYSCSFIAPGESALPIYMLTDVGQPAQTVMRRAAFNSASGYSTEFDHTNADKDMWFRMSLASDSAYIREKLALIRIHEQRETTMGFTSFYHPSAIYLSLYNQALWGRLRGYQGVLDKLPAAQRKLAMECLQIASFCLRSNARRLARQYMLFSRIVFEDVVNDERYKKLEQGLENPDAMGSEAPQGDSDDMFVKRKRSYDPPEGYQIIEVEDETRG